MNRLMFIRRENNGVLDKEPYATFIKKFDKLGNGILNKKFKWKIASKKGKDEDDSGFPLQNCYCERFDAEFEYYMVFDEEQIQNQKFVLIHTLSYKFDGDGDEFRNIMMYTISDLNKRRGQLYMSKLVKDCIIYATVDGKDRVNITYTVFCDREDAKEVSLQLLSNDVALFARTF